MRYYFWRFVHNGLVHPLIAVFGEWGWVMFLHDWTGDRWEGK